MAVILRIVIGPILPKSTETPITDTVMNPSEVKTDVKFQTCNICNEKTQQDEEKPISHCSHCGKEFTATEKISKRPLPSPITAKDLATEIKPEVTPEETILKQETQEEDINEYLQLLQQTYSEDKKLFENRPYTEELGKSNEDEFLKRLNEVQLLLKAKQDILKNFKTERKLPKELIQISTLKPPKKKADSFSEKRIVFSCQACDKEYQGLIKKINGSMFVEYEKDQFILQPNSAGYSFLYEHSLKDSIIHQTFVNLGKDFSVLSSEVFISTNGIKQPEIEEDEEELSVNEKFIPKIKYPCSLCKVDYEIKKYTKIKYESANQSTFVHVQTQHVKNDQHHLATLRIDLIDKMLVANPNVQLLATLPPSDNKNVDKPEKEVEVTM
jgi:ribosomal protein L37AE/L43A